MGNVSPVILIQGVNYTIFAMSYDIHSFVIFKDEKCQFFDAVIDQQVADSHFGITSVVNWTLNVYRCITSNNNNNNITVSKRDEIKQCNATVYYSLFQHWIPGCPLNEETVEVALTQWISRDAERDQSCISCQASGGICGYNASDSTARFICYCKNGPRTKNCIRAGRSINIGAVIGGLFGVTLVVVVVLSMCITVQRRRKHRMFTESFVVRGFKHDACKDMEAAIQGKIGTLPIFSYEVLRKATNDFDERNQLGDGGHGTVYLGKLPDGRVVAVKKLYHDNYKKVEQFYNEVQILSTCYHPNLVRLYGCSSPKDRDLLLVYEYVQNGTLADHLHGDRKADRGGLSWDTRLKICIETAQALAFLHCRDPPLFHRDVKSANILLDEDLHVKVGDFGVSRFMPLDATHISTAPQGTPGYIDPEYHICFQLSDRSDVYSFGVVLMEIISAKLAVDISREKGEIILANMAIAKMQAEALHEFIDPNLDFDTNSNQKITVFAVAKLALKCLAPLKEDRPHMKEVVAELEQIKQYADQYKYPSVIPLSPVSVREKWPSIGSTNEYSD